MQKLENMGKIHHVYWAFKRVSIVYDYMEIVGDIFIFGNPKRQ